jgi:xanthine dehydrogenase YagS FAD-binding subunit
VKAFAYVNATNEKDALAALVPERGKSVPIAGGQDLLSLMKDYILTPERVVNVKGLPTTIAVPVGPSADYAVVGAATRLADLAAHEAFRKAFPAIAEAAAEVGTPQIRNVGTVGGNLCQRPRCWYFRNEEFRCLKKGGARCFAVEGENQFHAIFGDAPCHIVHPSSLAVPLIAHEARIKVVGPSGEREVPAAEFFVMPDRKMYGENVLEPNELVTEVRIPIRPGVKSATYEVRYKQSHDWPIAFATAALTMTGDTVRSSRIVMGAVAPVPWRAEAAEKALAGKRVTEAVAMGAADAAVAEAKPMSGNGYKVQVVRTAVTRAILKAAGLLKA